MEDPQRLCVAWTDASLSDVREGWRLLEHGGKPFADLRSVLRGEGVDQVWGSVSSSKDEIGVMCFLYAAVEKQEPIVCDWRYKVALRLCTYALVGWRC